MTARNPRWSVIELILGLDLYFRANPLTSSKDHPEVVALSETLNRLRIHEGADQLREFRNPNGVYMKLCNFLRFDPSYEGKGLRKGGKLEEHVWNTFSGDRKSLNLIATSLKAALIKDSSERN